MSNNKTIKECDHNTPCESLRDFKRVMMWTIGITGGVTGSFCILILSLMLHQSNKTDGATAATAEVRNNQTRVLERLESLADRVDKNTQNSSAALARAGRAESDVAWIREGLTEIKMTIRTGVMSRKGNK